MEKTPYQNIQQEKTTEEKVEPEITIKPISTASDDFLEEDNTETKDEFVIYKVSEDNVPQPLVISSKTKEGIKEKTLTFHDKTRSFYTLRGTIDSITKTLKNLSPTVIELYPERYVEWYKLVEVASDNYMLSGDQLVEVTIREGSKWYNLLNQNTQEEPKWQGAITDRNGINPADTSDKRSTALATFTNILKLGSPAYICLYHTGIWLRLRTPTAADFATLDEKIVNLRVEYGNRTRGLVFSNDSVILREAVADFILDHVDWTTAPESSKEYLKSIIKVTDLDEMIRGIMQTRYPDGYPFSRICTANPEKCTHVVEGTIDLRTLGWVDNERLTAVQKTIIRSPRKRITEEQLALYQKEFDRSNSDKLVISPDNTYNELDGTLTNGVIIHFEQPTLEKDEEYGYEWVSEVQRIGEDAFKEKKDPKARQEAIDRKIATSFFKTYGQWIQSIEIYSNGIVVQKPTSTEELNEIYEYISSDANYNSKFIDAIQKYFKDSLVHICGVVNYPCPKCGAKYDTPEGNFYMILPIDMLSAFFTLVRHTIMLSTQESSTLDQ